MEFNKFEEMKENINQSKMGYKVKDMMILSQDEKYQKNRFERERRIKYQKIMASLKNNPGKRSSDSHTSSSSSISNIVRPFVFDPIIIDKHENLDPFIEYLEWTKMHFPSGHSSLLKVTEEAIRRFRKDERYKNDARYVELWMTVGKTQEDPNELFKYLIVNGIGSLCALFYEEYAGYKECAKSFDEADEIYRLGIEKKASPVSRLARQYESFLIRRQEIDPNGGAQVGINLAALSDHDEESSFQPNRRFSIHPPKSGIRKAGVVKGKAIKVFRDSKEDEIAGVKERLFPKEAADKNKIADFDSNQVGKENEIDVEKWSGTVYEQHSSAQSSIPAKKINVFKDDVEEDSELKRASKKSKLVLQPAKKAEKESIYSEIQETNKTIQSGFTANMDLCLVNGVEYSFEETRTAIMHKDALKTTISSFSPWKAPSKASLEKPSASSPKEMAFTEILEMFEEEKDTIPGDYQDSRYKPNSPTIHTKGALEAINDMFSTELEPRELNPSVIYNPEDDETISKQVYRRPDSDCKISVFKEVESDGEDEDFPIQSTPGPFRPVANLFGQAVHVMTPVTEYSDRTNSYTTQSVSTAAPHSDRPSTILEEETKDQTENTILYMKGNKNSQFSEIYLQNNHLPNPCNPTLPAIRTAILSRVKTPEKGNLHISALKTVDFCGILESLENQAIEFSTDNCFTVSQRLSSSGYYLVKDLKDGKASVIRCHEYPTVWEYYILFKLSNLSSISNLFISPKACFLFQNQSFLQLEYVDGGSLLDFVQCVADKGPTDRIPEVIAAFYTRQIISIVGTLHKLNIVHGDLRAENFLIRKETNMLVLTDFAAAIDLSAFPETQMFQLDELGPRSTEDEEADFLECWEFRNGCTWKYEPDWYGAAAVIHMLIFGKELAVTESVIGFNSKKEKQKPYMEAVQSVSSEWSGMWNHAFNTLLNLSSFEADSNPLDELHAEFDNYCRRTSHLLAKKIEEVLNDI